MALQQYTTHGRSARIIFTHSNYVDYVLCLFHSCCQNLILLKPSRLELHRGFILTLGEVNWTITCMVPPPPPTHLLFVFLTFSSQSSCKICTLFIISAGVLLPGQRIEFPFTFKSPNAGIFSETWSLQTGPVLNRGRPITVTLKGVAFQEDLNVQKREQLEVCHSFTFVLKRRRCMSNYAYILHRNC